MEDVLRLRSITDEELGNSSRFLGIGGLFDTWAPIGRAKSANTSAGAPTVKTWYS